MMSKDNVKLWLCSEVGRLELMRATYVHQRFARHAHERFALGFIEAGAIDSVRFEQSDCSDLPYADHHFDHVLVCFMLEHLANTGTVLKELRRVLKPGGALTVIEGDHGSFYCYPETEAARQTVRGLIDLQAEAGGDALIGRRLYPLMKQAGFEDVRVSPRVVYVDPSRPDWELGFSRDTFIAMVEGVGPKAIQRRMMTLAAWQQGIDDLKATIGQGTFHYTFFKAVARRANRGRACR